MKIKMIVAISILLIAGHLGTAQTIDEIKTQLMLNQLKKAKELVDAGATKPKVNSKPEYHILRAAIYSNFLNDKTSEFFSDTLRAFIKKDYDRYVELDNTKKLLTDPVYSNIPIQFYISHYNEASAAFNKQDWERAATSFDSTIYWSDYLQASKIANLGTVDTNAVVLAGASNQNAKRESKAAVYYERLIQNKVSGKDFEFLYQYMTDLYYRKEDIAGFDRVRKIGQELFPENEFFKNEEIDFMLSIEDLNDRMTRLDKYLVNNPQSFKAFAAKGDILFELLNPKDETAAAPENYDELEAKMVEAFMRASELDPTYAYGMSNLGYHFINRSVRKDKELSAQRKLMADKAAEARKNTPAPVKGKPAPPSFKQSPEDVAKRDALQVEITKANDNAIVYFEKAIARYAAISERSGLQKQQYKSAASYLIDLYKEKRDKSQPGSADDKKYAALEKKYNDLYSEISKQ